MEYDVNNVVYRGETARPVVEDSITKLTYDLQTMDRGVAEWGVNDTNEFSVIREDGKGFFASEVDLGKGPGMLYIEARSTTDEEVRRILEEYEEKGLEDMADHEKEWQNYLQCTFIDTSRRKFDDVSDFARKAGNILESRDPEQIIEGVSKIYSDEELGF